MNSSLETLINGWAQHNAFLDKLMIYSSKDLIFLAAPLLLLLWFWPGTSGSRASNQRLAVAAAIAGVVGLAFSAGISHMYMEARPFVAHPDTTKLLISHASDSGFPSDHTTVAFALGGTMVWWKRLLGSGVLLAGVLIGFSRVFVGVHWPVDIFAGAALGLACGSLMAWTVPMWTGLQRQLARFLPDVLVARPD